MRITAITHYNILMMRSPLLSWFQRIENQTLVGLCMGIGYGIGWPETTGWLTLPGDLFITLLKMIMLPLVLTTLLGAILLHTHHAMAKIGLLTAFYYVTTTLLAGIIGIGAFVLLGPDNAPVAAPAVTALQGPDKGLILEALAPGNPFSDAAQGRLLPLIVLTILLGLAFRQIPLDRRLFLSQFNDGLAQGMQVVTGWIIRLAPLGAFALVARYMALYGETLAANILWLMGVIAIAALIHGLVVLPLLAMEPGSVPG